MTPKIPMPPMSRAAARTLLVAVAVGWLASCSGADPRPSAGGLPAAGSRTGAPGLAVVIIVDQMRGDYLDRFASRLDGGLARLAREGLVFTDAHQDHALTATGPGHAVLLTGVAPALNGIIGNRWFDRAPQGGPAGSPRGCVADPKAPSFGGRGGVSPINLAASTLGEWIQALTPASRVVTISGKDRGAVLPAGRAHGASVFWYDSKAGGFTTSSAYAPALPEVAARFNAAHEARTHLCESWTPLDGRADLSEADADDAPWEPAGGRTFPHVLPCDRDSARTGAAGHDDLAPAEQRITSEIAMTPLWDEMAIDFAEDLIVSEQLGRDDAPDLLVLALSGTDYIGHGYGPDSQELLDQLRRLDRRLGVFLETLDRLPRLDGPAGSGSVIVALSADHGVQSAPERGASLGFQRVDPDEFLKRIESRMTAKLGPPPSGAPNGTPGTTGDAPRDHWLLASENFDLYLARPAGDSRARQAVEDAAVDALLAEPVVAHVYRASEIAALPAEQPIEATLGAIGAVSSPGSRSGPDAFLPLIRASWTPERSGDVVFRIQPGWLLEPADPVASHGTPYFNDTHVTLVLRGPGIPPGRHTGRVSTRQLAPALARLLGVTPPPEVTAPALGNQ